MTFPTKDLMLFEEIEDDIRQIADSYNYPMHLLGFKAGTTFSNYLEAKKSMYSDGIIPNANTIFEAISKFFVTEDFGFTLKAFYDHLDVFQKSRKEDADAFRIMALGLDTPYKSGVITREEYRIKLEFDPVKFEGSTFYQLPTQAQNGNQQGQSSDSDTSSEGSNNQNQN